MRPAYRQLFLVAALGFVASGCSMRFQGGEAFSSALTPVDYAAERQKPGAWKGDPYAFGGSADASGGTKPQTSYGAGARPDSSEPFDVRMNNPAKGTGRNPGEFPTYADPSYGNSNAPFAQPRPSAAGPVGTAR